MGNLQDKVSTFHGRTKNLFSEFGNVAPRVLLLGIDGAGKTSLLYKAKLNSTMYANVPPIGVSIEEMTPKRGATIAVWDMRGDKVSRHLWRNYYLKTEAIIFVVDSSDKVRLDEAQYELSQILESRYLSKVPLIVAANKQDAEGALGTDEVADLLELEEIQDRHWSILGSNSKKGKGVKDVFKEVVNLIKLTRKDKIQRKSELLKKHNDDLKNTKEMEIEVKTPLEKTDNDDLDESIKKYSLFENINKSNSLSEDENENASKKSDQYDTVFSENINDYHDIHKDADRSEDADFEKSAQQTINRAFEPINDENTVNDGDSNAENEMSNGDDADEKLSTGDSEADEKMSSGNTFADNKVGNGDIDADNKMINADTDADKVGEHETSLTEVKVTDLDSDSGESLQDHSFTDHYIKPDDVS